VPAALLSSPAVWYLQRQLEAGVAWPSPGSKFWEGSPRTNPMPVDVGAGSSSVQPRDSRSLDIVHFTAELAPIAKVSNASRGAFKDTECLGLQPNLFVELTEAFNASCQVLGRSIQCCLCG
jgi:hypothetical protein